MIHSLNYKSQIKADIKTVFDFFSNPQNLNTITPPDMNFKILSGADRKMYPGQIIIYKVSPFPMYYTTWVTEITQVISRKMFIDEQRFGPFAFWHHQHIFTETDNGVEAEDIIHYKLPFGILGELSHQLFIKKRLQKIFNYRKNILNEIF
jgi:ligand-binding SRPBCC domain-containing protein